LPSSGGKVERVLATKRAVQVLDLAADDTYLTGHAYVELGGARTIVDWPLLREGSVVGLIAIYRQEVRAFSKKEIALLENFAAQAVIALESARLLGELRQRSGDLQESLEYQTATSDVLKVISRSTFDLDPVFQAVVTTAVRLCRADQATIYRCQDCEYRWAAGFGLAPDYERIERESRIRPGTGTLVGRVALGGRTLQIIDAWTDPLYEAKDDARAGGVHTMLGVPLLRDGVPIGVIGLARRRIEPYTERQIALVSTFAEQGVIAIGSVATVQALQERTAELTRSVAELQALEEVLRAINSSLDLDAVLDTIISRAVQLSRADEGTIYEYDKAEEVFVPMAAFGMTVERLTALRERRVRLGKTHLGRAAVQRAPVHTRTFSRTPRCRG
jgi:GAF domain-containing protein